ncbi:MAG: 1,6-anhydro-N-acetylmuramyl-L-alanine amidase AmpD [Cardiobacteriaceae bacterium]|nr:1,6-anhydro-N-acetylmuramyl-L-alanine amidase AmpD [Cardiobacteriaceae bacterium]
MAWNIDDDGWLDVARKISSPHFNARPENTEIDLVVLHNISLPPKQFGSFFVEKFFLGEIAAHISEDEFFPTIRDLRVSAHFFIARDGEIIQFVATENRAWHAGVSNFYGRENCNDFSVGIEINGADDIPYTLRQYQAIAELIRALMRKYPKITAEKITTHSFIAPNRKTDPGEAFNIDFLRQLLVLP